MRRAAQRATLDIKSGEIRIDRKGESRLEHRGILPPVHMGDEVHARLGVPGPDLLGKHRASKALDDRHAFIQRAAGDRGDGGIAIHVIGVFLVIHIDVPAVPGCGPVLESHKPVAAGAG